MLLQKKKCLNVVEGKIINIIEEKDINSPTGIYFTPVFEYIVDSKKYVKESQLGDPINKHYVGETIKIYYNSTNPNQCYEKTLNHTYIIIMGIFCIITGFFYLLFF